MKFFLSFVFKKIFLGPPKTEKKTIKLRKNVGRGGGGMINIFLIPPR